MTANDWYIVRSKSGIGYQDGCPIPQMLCRSKEEALKVLEERLKIQDDMVMVPYDGRWIL